MEIVAGLVLAASAGWNGLLPLLVAALAERLGRRVGLVAPYDLLASTGAIIALLVLLPIEIIGDKVPGFDARNDRAGYVYRPLAGAVLMAATTRSTPLPELAALGIGAATALAMHLLKVWYRRPLTDTPGILGGIGQPTASFMEDITVAATAILALLVAPVGAAILALVAALAAWCGVALRRRDTRRGVAVTPQP